MSQIVRHTSIQIEAHEHYQKRSYRNRIHLCGPQGLMSTSIPLKKGKNAQKAIRDVQISYESPWREILVKQIKANYGSAPFFHYIIDDLEPLIMRNDKFLWDYNQELFGFVCKQLSLTTSSPPKLEVSDTEAYHSDYQAQALDLRSKFKPNSTDASLMPYEQVFSNEFDFIPDLSILDMLMCCGPESILKLKA